MQNGADAAGHSRMALGAMPSSSTAGTIFATAIAISSSSVVCAPSCATSSPPMAGAAAWPISDGIASRPISVARAGYEVVGVFKETGSGAKVDRAERRKVMALAQRREIDSVLVTELSRWGRSTLDLLHTLKQLEAWRVSVIAMNGLAFDLSTPHGRMMATIIAGIAEFERELIRECVRSGIAAASGLGGSRGSGRNPIASPRRFWRLSPMGEAIA